MPEQNGRQMVGRPRAGRRECHLIGILLKIGDQISGGIDRKIRTRNQHIGRAHQQRQEIEVLERIVFEILVQNRVDGIDANRSDQQRVAVGRGRFHTGSPEPAVGASAVFNDHGFSDPFPQFVADQPRGDVRSATRRKWHHNRDVAFRIIGRMNRRGESGRERQNGEQADCVRLHRQSSLWPDLCRLNCCIS